MDMIERLRAEGYTIGGWDDALSELEAQQAEIARLREALAGRCLGEGRYRRAASKALHILRRCPDKQEKAEAILAAALEAR